MGGAPRVERVMRRARRWLRAGAAAARAVLGAPDYERYLAHMRERHAGATPLDRAEYLRQRLEARYSRPGARCC
jgi:uncharacterized short protein YbdD (DUF466 family)